MKKTILYLLLLPLLLFITGEIACRLAGLQPKSNARTEQLAFSMQPDSFYVNDMLLGWRMGRGSFRHLKDDTFLVAEYHNNQFGNRITSPTDSTVSDSLPGIFLFGCSYTFGYSVSDTCNYPFYLQTALPHYKVWNKGVPGYSFTQMFLSLKDEVENKKHSPRVAVFNYASVHDMRTPLFYNWSAFVKHGFKLIANNQSLGLVYPYAFLRNDILAIENYDWNDLPDDFPLRDKSALINLLNTSYYNWHDARQVEMLHKVSVLTALKIADYCKQHHIPLVFAGMDAESKLVFDRLKDTKANTMLFNVDVTKEGYNCDPVDKGHPSPKAHREYAKELHEFLLSKKLTEE